MKEKKSLNSDKIIYFLSIFMFLAFSLYVFIKIGRPLIAFIDDPEQFRIFVDKYGLMGKVMFIGMVALQVIIAAIPGEPFEIAAGYAFGFWEGTLLSVLGISLGSAAIFAIVRYFGKKAVKIFFTEENIKSLSFLRTDPKKDLIMLIIFLVPGTPKDLITYFAGLTDIKFSLFFLLSSVARLPSVLTSTAAGNALGTQNYDFAAVAFVGAAAIAALGLYFYKKFAKSKR